MSLIKQLVVIVRHRVGAAREVNFDWDCFEKSIHNYSGQNLFAEDGKPPATCLDKGYLWGSKGQQVADCFAYALLT